MSTPELSKRIPRRPGRAWLATALAGVIQLAALMIAISGGSLAALAIWVALAGVAIAAYVLAPRALGVMRRHRELIVLLPLIAGGVWWVSVGVRRVGASESNWLSYGFSPDLLNLGPQLSGQTLSPWRLGSFSVLPLMLLVLTSAGGLVLTADAVRVYLGFEPRRLAPWTQISESPARPPRIGWRAAVGLLLVGWAAFLAIGLAGPLFAGNPPMQVVVLILVAAGATILIGLPLTVGALMRLYRDRAGDAREQERQRFAAHLHDSVLQTLALVQRQAYDPAAVARLARRQEHALRAWMAGESELVSETLVAALRDAVASVEDEHGITVELTAIGDRPLDPAGEALVAAAREALRNAARHAPGAAVVVFAEIFPCAAEIFVRDDGAGFDPDGVAPERRGIRDAIVGRMAFAGGQASVESVFGEGTEVALRIGAPTGKPSQGSSHSERHEPIARAPHFSR
jgi:signal transduction histidine kinase